MFATFRTVLFLGLAQLIPQAANAESEDPSKAQVKLSDTGEAVHYRGEMDNDAIARVAALIKAAGGTVTRLVIDSGGGEINGGMDLAELVLAHQLDVEVERLCASSCANYVFPAGNTKHIQEGAVVVWHGSAIQEEVGENLGIENIQTQEGGELSLAEKRLLLDQNREKARRYIADARLRQGDLFKRMGVDERVTVVGQQLKAAEEWTLTVDDMARFGVKNVFAPEYYGEDMPDVMRKRGVKLLYMEDYPDYKLAR